MNAIKIYGERNSGTNYLEQLVALNLDTQILRFVPSRRIGKYLKYEILSGLLFAAHDRQYLGWKHGIPKIRQINNYRNSNLAIVTIVKNPYAFLLSLYKRPYHYRDKKPDTFLAFLHHEWKTILRDNCNKYKYDSPIDLWNNKNRAYLSLKEVVNRPVINIRYEDLLADPKQIIDLISTSTDTPYQANNSFNNLISSTKGDDATFEYYRDYYLNEKWRTELSKEAIELINQKLDTEILKHYDYQQLLPLS